MKITKTVGQCLFCEIDTDVSTWGMDQFIGDNEFLDIPPEDKIEYIKKFSKLLSKRFDVVLED